MHDIRALRERPDAYVRGWSRRGVDDPQAVVDVVLDLDARLRAAQTAGQEAQARRNDASKRIGQAKARKDEAEAARLMAEVEGLKAQMAADSKAETDLASQLKDRLAALPNLAADDVPEGEDESGNVEQGRWGDAHALPAGRLNAPKDHVDLGEALGMMDFEVAARMSGARFVVLKKDLARLERALGQFMLDLQTEQNGYVEVSPPLLVRDDAMFGTGQLPKFEEDLFEARSQSADIFHYLEVFGFSDAQELKTEIRAEFPDLSEAAIFAKAIRRGYTKFVRGERKYYLIPTAEVSLTNLVREQITPEAELPLRLTALTPCFRAEAGASGRDTRGMIRQHQFSKVEMVSITTPDQSAAEHDRMVECAQGVLKALGLPFRTMLLCAGDMGFSARKTYDLEVWLPSQNTYREISSISNCGDFQARRMDARTKAAGEKGTRFVHTLNGSGLAVGRALVAVMENYQDEGGRIAVPDVLVPYMRGATHIGGAA